MRLNNLIDDEEYLREKKKLMKEKIRLEQNLKNGSKEKDADEKTKKALTLANQGKDRFQNASLEDKRAILQEIGSNFLLTQTASSLLKRKNPSSSLKKG